MIFSASAWSAESWLNSIRRNRCTPTKYFAASASDSKYVMMGKALWPGVSRRFGKTAELILVAEPQGKQARKSVNCGEILPNSYDLKQAGIGGTQVIVLLSADTRQSSDEYPSAVSLIGKPPALFGIAAVIQHRGISRKTIQLLPRAFFNWAIISLTDGARLPSGSRRRHSWNSARAASASSCWR